VSWEEELRRIRLKKLRELEKKLRGGRQETGKVLELDSGGLRKLLRSSNTPVLVDFWAPWCMPCLMVKPVFKELAREYAGRVVFASVNVDENPAVARAFKIMAIPTFILFKKGRPVEKVMGAAGRETFERVIRKHLS